MAISEKGVAAGKAFGQDSKAFLDQKLGEGKIAELEKQLKFIEQGLESAETTQEIEKLNKRKNKVMEQLGMTNKDGGKQKFKEGSKPDFLDLDKDGDKTEPMKQAAKQKVTAKGGVRTAIAKIKKAKDGSRTGVRGTGAAKRGFRKARLS